MICRLSIFLLFALLLSACGNSDPEFDNLEEEIRYLINEDRYEEALNRLEPLDRDEPETARLLEMTYLNYGLHMMDTFDEQEMRTRMNEAMRHFTEVLRINPDNEMARNQIDQILDVYDTIPNRDPEPDVLDGLREVGYSL